MSYTCIEFVPKSSESVLMVHHFALSDFMVAFLSSVAVCGTNIKQQTQLGLTVGMNFRWDALDKYIFTII